MLAFSGATLERPALKELLMILKKKKLMIVLVYKRLIGLPDLQKLFYQIIEFLEQSPK